LGGANRHHIYLKSKNSIEIKVKGRIQTGNQEYYHLREKNSDFSSTYMLGFG
jgi:hypothetical protein